MTRVVTVKNSLSLPQLPLIKILFSCKGKAIRLPLVASEKVTKRQSIHRDNNCPIKKSFHGVLEIIPVVDKSFLTNPGHLLIGQERGHVNTFFNS